MFLFCPFLSISCIFHNHEDFTLAILPFSYKENLDLWRMEKTSGKQHFFPDDIDDLTLQAILNNTAKKI